MVDDPPDHAVLFHLAKLLDQHWEIAGIARSSSEKRRTFPPKRWNRMKELPSPFEHLERLLHILRGGDGRVFLALTLG